MKIERLDGRERPDLDLPRGLNLRAPDALHAFIALRCGADLATADKKLIRAARQLGLVVIEP